MYRYKMIKNNDITEYINKTASNPPSINTRPHTNLTKSERQALKKLKHNRDIVIKKADKGSVIVVQNKIDYIQEGEQHLSDQTTYQLLPGDSTNTLIHYITTLASELFHAGYIDKYTSSFLSPPEEARTQCIYFLKKLHKIPHKVRPIVSGSSGATENVSAFLDKILQPTVISLPSYVRDSTHIVALLSEHKFPPNIILVTIDVTSLYTSIPQEEGISACLHCIQNNNHTNIPPKVLKALFEIVLKGNIFRFGDKIYCQLTGTAMGTRMAPNYANCFMHTLETTFLQSQPLKPFFWKRFIDDILMLWPHTSESLTTFLQNLNSFHQNIKFTWEISHTKVVYLDLEISKGSLFKNTGKLDIQTHFKTTNTFQYLHYTSSHPRSTFKGIIKGEAIRFIRTNTSETVYNSILCKVISHFRHRGYPLHFIENSLKDIKYSNRASYLTPSKKNLSTNTPRFFIQYSPHYSSISICLSQHWDIITKNKQLTKLFTSKPQVCYRKNPSIANQIVRASISKNTSKLFSNLAPLTPQKIQRQPLQYSCHRQNCTTCQHLLQHTVIHCIYTRKTFTIKQIISCNNKNVIYLLRCNICSKLFTGKTNRNQSLRDRHLEHIKSSKSQSNMKWPLYYHFTSHNLHFLNNHTIIPLQKCQPKFLDTLEKVWIEKLSTLIPTGLNHST